MVFQLIIYFLAGAILTAILGHFLIPVLRRLKVGQSIRSDGPQAHLGKAGTPTMGGLMFIPVMVILCLFMKDKTAELGIWVYSFLAFGLIGLLDDTAKLRHHENKGLSGRQKLVGQFAAVAILLLFHWYADPEPTMVYFFSESLALDLKWTYYPIMAILMVGMVNAVNLTDGLDGLAAGASVPVFFGFLCALAAGSGSVLMLVAAALIGGCIGFLLYNHHPAKVFMGDTGSMALGGAVVGLAIAGDMEVLMIGFGLLYLLEALSVMLQVGYFKLTHKRLFRMAPLHHHFEMKGLKETQVTAVFWAASAVFVFLTLVLYTII